MSYTHYGLNEIGIAQSYAEKAVDAAIKDNLRAQVAIFKLFLAFLMAKQKPSKLNKPIKSIQENITILKEKEYDTKPFIWLGVLLFGRIIR